MAKWQNYIRLLMEDDLCQDAAIFCACDCELLAAHPRGLLENLTYCEMCNVVDCNRSCLHAVGLMLGGQRCMVIRDHLYQPGFNCMDLRTMPEKTGKETQSVAIIRINHVCLILIGKKGVAGGTLNFKAFKMACHIQENECK
ncbi:hypothetical protein NDU88_003730 [Pleurodeles waltl]|uniref:Profilin n=1 Tax=Pleurodeles waltl TaxID=8319 RepID=A0AAV7LGD6_PLEWA|nr:hypothetical protein NDU88_003730 [Pleurodeles waltl]